MLTEDIVGIIVGVPGVIVFTFLVMRYKLKKELGPVVDALRDDLDDTREQLAEVQERLDFAERVLTAGRASQEDRNG